MSHDYVTSIKRSEKGKTQSIVKDDYTKIQVIRRRHRLENLSKSFKN